MLCTAVLAALCHCVTCSGFSLTAGSLLLAQGQLPAGDLIPWVVSQQFQDKDFPSLEGARVVRICTHPVSHFLTQSLLGQTKGLRFIPYPQTVSWVSFPYLISKLTPFFQHCLRNHTLT